VDSRRWLREEPTICVESQTDGRPTVQTENNRQSCLWPRCTSSLERLTSRRHLCSLYRPPKTLEDIYCLSRLTHNNTGRIAAKRQAASIKFNHRPKIRFRPTRWTDSRQTWCGRRARGFGWLCKISPQSAQGIGNAAPKIWKITTFGKESPHRGEPFDRFLKFLWAFYAQLSYVSVSNLTRFASQVTVLLLRNRASVN